MFTGRARTAPCCSGGFNGPADDSFQAMNFRFHANESVFTHVCRVYAGLRRFTQGYLMFTQGLSKVYARFTHGLCKVYSRFAHGLCKVYARFTQGYAVFAQGLCKVYAGLLDVYARFAQGLSKVCA